MTASESQGLVEHADDLIHWLLALLWGTPPNGWISVTIYFSNFAYSLMYLKGKGKTVL